MSDKTSRRTVLASAGTGAALLAAFAGMAQAADMSAAERANVAVVDGFRKADPSRRRWGPHLPDPLSLSS